LAGGPAGKISTFGGLWLEANGGLIARLKITIGKQYIEGRLIVH
jgi:hypothetical protein